MSINNFSVSESDASETSENTYCILLHIVEGVGLTSKESTTGAGGDLGNQRKNVFLLKVSLNGVHFEVEGHSLTPESAAIFNSNCIWECGLDDVKRMKTDNRPVKLECFLKNGRSKNASSKMIGSLLLPIRGVKTINNLTQCQLKFYWHKLGTLNAEWRQNRPEIYLMLMIVKKDIIGHGQLEALIGKHKRSTLAASNNNVMLSPNVCETVFMLQSQSNVYVQLLEQFGQIQVGNNPEDCEIFSVTLTFKQVKNVIGLLGLAQPMYQSHVNCFVFQYDFFGSNSIVEIIINPTDCYTINEKIALSFRSSLKSLRLYFQRIFYIPINLYYNDAAVANYQFDFSKLLPDDTYFTNIDRVWTKNGSFNFERLHKILSPRAFKPSVDFIFSIQLVIPYAKRNNYEIAPLNETFAPNERDDKLQLCGNMYHNLDMPHVVQAFKQMPFDICMTGRHLNRFETYDDPYKKDDPDGAADLCAKSATEYAKDDPTEKNQLKCLEYSLQNKTNDVGVLIEDEPQKTFSSIATNTDSCDIKDHEELTIQIVQELEDWKSQQMENFINELKRKEETHIKDLQNHWEQQRVILEARLKAKMDKCDQLNAQLDKAQMELHATATKNHETINIADTIKRDIELNYAKKFNALETEMQSLKLEIQQRGTVFELKNKQVLFDNTCLELEKAELKERTEQLEKQLTMLQNTHLSADQLNDVHNDMHKQRERCVAMEKSRNFYKEQWAYASQKVDKLKVKLLKVREVECERNTLKNTGFEFCLDEILNEEQDILKSDRSELKSIQLSLLSSSDSSCPDELVSERLT